MNEIGYDLLTDASIKRKVTILTHLLESEVPLPLSELADFCEVSLKTLRRDVQTLGDYFPDTIYQENAALSLNPLKSREPISKFIDEQIKGNMLFTIVEDTFYGECEPIEYLSEKFFVAESTLRKHLSLLKKVLKPFDLTLNLSPVEILGNEVNIRYFYFHFFEHSLEYSGSVYPEAKQSDLYNLLRSFLHKHGLVLNVNYHRLICWFFISEQRIRQKKLVYLDKSIIDKYASFHAVFTIRNALEKMSPPSVMFAVSESEIIFSFLLSLDTIVYDAKSHFLPNDFLIEMEKYENLVTDFFKVSNLTYALNVELKAIIKAFLVNEHALQGLTGLFHKNKPRFNSMIQKKYPDTYSIWIKILKKQTDFDYISDLAVSLTALTKAKVNRSRKVLFAFNGTSAETAYYKYQAQKYVPKTTETLFIFNQPIDNDLIERLDIDFCVCNFSLSVYDLSCKFFKFASVPSVVEWETLTNKLSAI
ncbi:helix-turn-helix domain-containing protein [Candidatus Enterococcus clewellii]|uniref:Mga helix-turn-helix domain-containing protein n=1 Tax=Candidatus Enterococcus clewellii TaxID=1834193 RepID=A0A242K9Z2_9ENTE|nr:helix-turn-helix domain-containing protein [Enterococcus sp. 9E7_DIV0242]OTP17598.1 hypothetical protein A5888_001736 [Enterococcus sp. 9E7_DIV0242]